MSVVDAYLKRMGYAGPLKPNSNLLPDVGFGDCFLEPLRFATGFEQLQGGRKYRIVDENGSLHVERTELDDRWKRQYSFTLTPRRLDEFAAMCLYHQTSPESPFTRKKLCTLATADR